MKCVILFVLAAVALTNAWPLRNDLAQQQARAAKVASDDLDKWQAASAANDRAAQAELLQVVLDLLNSADANNKTLLPRIGGLIKRINQLASDRVSSWLVGRKTLQLLIKAVEGNRDNQSYYDYEGANQWIEQRLASATGDLKDQLAALQANIVAAREILEGNAQAFVKGIAELSRLTGSADNVKEVQEVARGMAAQSATAARLPTATKVAIDQAQQIIDGLRA